MATIRKRKWKSGDLQHEAWVVDYFDQAGVRRLKTFDTKREAESWKTTAQFEIRQGTHTPASVSVTVDEAIEQWIANCEAEKLERSTVKQREEHRRLHIRPFIGSEKLSSLTMPRIVQFDAQLREAGRSLAMRRKVLVNLKTGLSWAQGRGLVAQNVARDVKIKAKSEERMAKGPLREGVDFPSKAELRVLIDTAADRGRPFLLTAIFTGMRASELRGLSWSDIDLDAGVIHVRQRADAWRDIGDTKSKSGKRDIPLTPMVINSLRQWKAVCPKGEAQLVFPNGIGNVESHQNILNRFFFPLQIAAGVFVVSDESDGEGVPVRKAKYAMHSLRHAAASLFIAHLGWTPKRVQAVMGHSSINMTFDLYGHLFEDHDADREAMKKIEAAVIAA